MLVGAAGWLSSLSIVASRIFFLSSSQSSMSLLDCFCPDSVPWVDPLIGLLQVFSLARVVGLCYVILLFVVLYLGSG